MAEKSFSPFTPSAIFVKNCSAFLPNSIFEFTCSAALTASFKSLDINLAEKPGKKLLSAGLVGPTFSTGQ